VSGAQSGNGREPSSGLSDPFVVSTDDLAAVVERWIVAHEADHPAPNYNAHDPDYQPSAAISGLTYIAEWAGVPIRSVTRVLRRETRFTTLEVADRLLVVTECSHLLADDYPGGLRVVPNPYWSQERWHAYMSERGCEPE